MVATILIIFVRINFTNFVQFTKQRQYRQPKPLRRSGPSGAKPTWSWKHLAIIQSMASKQLWRHQQQRNVMMKLLQ